MQDILKESASNNSAPSSTENSGISTNPDKGHPGQSQKQENRERMAENKEIETNADELCSDGSASAFEGTESIDSHDNDISIKRKEEQLRNDPSGRSNY
jgi:hypothetical protein